MSTEKYRATIVHTPGQLGLITVYEGYVSKYNYTTHNWDILYNTCNDFKLPVWFGVWRAMKNAKKIDKLRSKLMVE